MGAPHNKERYGELWPNYRISSALEELEKLKSLVVLSGGWAWHFISQQGHPELKHAHDHKDIDLFVAPENVAKVVELLKKQGFEKVWTKYDKLQSKEDFRRYEKTVWPPVIRITIDFFVRDIPFRKIKGWKVVDPKHLVTLYNNIHSSDKCFAVEAARKLLALNIDPVDRPELTMIPKETK